MQNTPQSNRLHIALYGNRNTGKSSLINALTAQEVALVSSTPGTTTDPVYKAMEIHGIGPVLFMDTAGVDDTGKLGEQRVAQTQKTTLKADVALWVCTELPDARQQQWLHQLKERGTPTLIVLNKIDQIADYPALATQIEQLTQCPVVAVSALQGTGIEELLEQLRRINPLREEDDSIVGHLVSKNDVVLLVMPQDLQAPKGRLILPQVQTIRNLLDNQCVVVSCITSNYLQALDALKTAPKLIITDSQAFDMVYRHKPQASALTSFSVLFAKHKGDIAQFVQGAKAIDALTPQARVLIAEACTHAPLKEDIGREKIPALLRKRFGNELQIDIVSGSDFPEDLTPYQLIVHCGACMFNRTHVLQRLRHARQQGVPMTNYGICMAHLSGILDKVVY